MSLRQTGFPPRHRQRPPFNGDRAGKLAAETPGVYNFWLHGNGRKRAAWVSKDERVSRTSWRSLDSMRHFDLKHIPIAALPAAEGAGLKGPMLHAARDGHVGETKAAAADDVVVAEDRLQRAQRAPRVTLRPNHQEVSSPANVSCRPW